MNEPELQQYLYDHIPLSKAMEVEVLSITSHSVKLSAPLEPNINHRETVFGGSASAVAILSAWCLLHTSLRRAGHGPETRLVIQRNTMEYTLPIVGRFTSTAQFAADEAASELSTELARFLNTLKRHKKARISVSAKLEFGGQICGSLTGDFVALNY
ncbi:MAG: YiiD C-terminal domain-containing protein [Candidatus Methylacidiphilales bacterium]|nr:YiiD C-terminal domain-containing protein [Candidatus Methylacidiphilales bacterium]